MSILKVTKETLEDRYSIYHSAITFTNAFAHCGTTSDTFLRENLDWLGRASNWAKFSTTAALGLIHRGSWVNGNRVVKPYLPGGAAPNKYSEGGALFALGLIYAGRVEFAEEELKKGLAEGNDPIVQHGAALGMGVSALASADDEIYDQIRPILFQDDAVAGEAAGYAMGLVMLGTASERALEEMLSYARETQHEKIIRGLAMGIAFLMYGQREAANPVIQRLTEDKVSFSGFQPLPNTDEMSRMPSSDMVVCSPSPLPLLVPVTTRPSRSFSMSLSLMSMTMYDGLLSPLLVSYSSGTTLQCLGLCSCWPRVITPMLGMVRRLLWVSLVLVLVLR